ncbi:MAG: hypothetical protein ABR497_12695, partial [Kiritimatiellia bacterium]
MRPRGPHALWDADLADRWSQPAVTGGPPPYVSGGLPLGRGTFAPGTPVTLTGPGGRYPVQVRPLAFWPDGSVKWLHLVFALDGASGTAADGADPGGGERAAYAFQVTRRNGDPLDFTLRTGAAVTPPEPAGAVRVDVLETTADDDAPARVRVDTGPL